MKCPNCQAELTDKQVSTLNAQRCAAKRQTIGRPPLKCQHPMTPEEMAKCQRCKRREQMRRWRQRKAEERSQSDAIENRLGCSTTS